MGDTHDTGHCQCKADFPLFSSLLIHLLLSPLLSSLPLSLPRAALCVKYLLKTEQLISGDEEADGDLNYKHLLRETPFISEELPPLQIRKCVLLARRMFDSCGLSLLKAIVHRKRWGDTPLFIACAFTSNSNHCDAIYFTFERKTVKSLHLLLLSCCFKWTIPAHSVRYIFFFLLFFFSCPYELTPELVLILNTIGEKEKYHNERAEWSVCV